MQIVLAVTGGVAVYKSVHLTRLLKDQGHDVRIVMTKSAQSFVTPLCFQAVSNNHVYTDVFDTQSCNAMAHIELAKWADKILIAPASANTIAKMSAGIADDLLSTILLASEAPVTIAPAMNKQMWLHPATQANLNILRTRGVGIIGPDSGKQACGDIGYGRMTEPEIIASYLFLEEKSVFWSNKKIMITAGPTREAIDPIRYISNRSTGKMGYALASVAAKLGAHVLLIAGPTSLPDPDGVTVVHVNNAEQMNEAVFRSIDNIDVFIGAAAIANYRLSAIEKHKIKSQSDTLTLALVKTPDVIAKVAAMKQNRPLVIGFSAETNDLIANAKAKLERKGLDMIIANQIGDNQGMAADTNAATVLYSNGKQINFPEMPKVLLARKLLLAIEDKAQES